MNQHDFCFSFQRLEVYRVAREALDILVKRRGEFKRLPGNLGPQLHGAMVSVTINIAEGAGRVMPGDQRRSYQIALGSANEVAACTDIARVCGVSEELTRAILSRMARVVPMLLKLSASTLR